MEQATDLDLQTYSTAVTRLVENAGAFVVAVKSAAYRVSSGVIFRDDLIAVANHALRREGAVPVHLPDGSEASATILGRDAPVDVAILKVSGAKRPSVPANGPIPAAGALVAVVGRTLDCGLSASVGILGAVGGPRRTWRGEQVERFLRLDVNSYPSQAGAAVVLANGTLLGMATAAMLRHSTVAVPPETLDRIANELLSQGKIRQGYLGISLQLVGVPEKLRAETGRAAKSGLMVLSIEPGTSAEEGGLELGDILVASGETLLEDPETLQGVLRGDAVGKPLKFTVLRGGRAIEIELRIAARPT
jgi:S1-C subfamily serine protease